MEDTPDPVVAGGLLTYAITVKRFQTATFTLTVQLPETVRFVSAKVAKVNGPPSNSGDCVSKARTVYCRMSVDAKGSKATIVVVPTRPGPITSTASAQVYHSVEPPLLGNARTVVVSPLDVSIAAPRLAAAQEELRYELTVANCSGCAPVTDSTITDQLPTGVTFRSASSGRGPCDEVSGKVSCPLGILYSGDRVKAA
jgi:uncharacterized repeat protein (TIGR01451 family)